MHPLEVLLEVDIVPDAEGEPVEVEGSLVLEPPLGGRHRRTQLGEVADREWRGRSGRLSQRRPRGELDGDRVILRPGVIELDREAAARGGEARLTRVLEHSGLDEEAGARGLRVPRRLEVKGPGERRSEE